MKQFLIFAGKEFRHIFRDRRTMLILLVMPVVQIILFGFAITTEVQNVRMAVLDPSDDVLARRIIEQLDASEYFTLSARFQNPQEMDEAFRRSQVDMAVVFTPEFPTGSIRVSRPCSLFAMPPILIRQPCRPAMLQVLLPLPRANCYRLVFLSQPSNPK